MEVGHVLSSQEHNEFLGEKNSSKKHNILEKFTIGWKFKCFIKSIYLARARG
jgi:hypothetical protein